jgi:hypothetical protein
MQQWQQGLSQLLAFWAKMAQQYTAVMAPELGLSCRHQTAAMSGPPGELSARLAALEERLERLVEQLETAIGQSAARQLDTLAARLETATDSDIRAPRRPHGAP